MWSVGLALLLAPAGALWIPGALLLLVGAGLGASGVLRVAERPEPRTPLSALPRDVQRLIRERGAQAAAAPPAPEADQS